MVAKSEFIIRITAKSEHLPVNSFLALLTGTVETLHGISNAISEAKDKDDDFSLRISRIAISSPGEIALLLDERANTEHGERVFREHIDSCRLISKKRRMPEYFDEEVLSSFQESMRPLSDGIAEVEFSYKRKRVAPSRGIVENIRYIIHQEEKISYFTWTSLEGKLLVIVSGEGKQPSFKIKDPLLPRPVKCAFDQQMVSAVLNAFEKRVSVFGKTKYNRHDIPVSIQVEKFEVFPDESSLPSYDDLPAYDVTDGVDIHDFLERARNAV
jgi:hypothetical protein